METVPGQTLIYAGICDRVSDHVTLGAEDT